MGVTVITANDTRDLTTIRRLKLELNIPLTDSSQDELLAAWIHEESENFARMCKRVLSAELVSEDFDLRSINGYRATDSSSAPTLRPDMGIVLSRYPVTEVQSVTLDGVDLDASTYAAESEKGVLRRTRVSGGPIGWSGIEMVVTYWGGYTLLGTLPRPIESAVLTMCKARKFAAARDPTVRSMNIVGAMSETYGVGGSSSGAGSLHGQPADVESAVAYYTDLRV